MLGVNFAIPLSCEQSLCVHLLLTLLPLYALLIFLASFSCFVSFLDVGFQSYFLLWGHLCFPFGVAGRCFSCYLQGRSQSSLWVPSSLWQAGDWDV